MLFISKRSIYYLSSNLHNSFNPVLITNSNKDILIDYLTNKFDTIILSSTICITDNSILIPSNLVKLNTDICTACYVLSVDDEEFLSNVDNSCISNPNICKAVDNISLVL
jgi:hypothetical protein